MDWKGAVSAFYGEGFTFLAVLWVFSKRDLLRGYFIVCYNLSGFECSLLAAEVVEEATEEVHSVFVCFGRMRSQQLVFLLWLL